MSYQPAVEELSQTFAGDQWPKFLACHQQTDAEVSQYVISILVDSNISWFTGHFPEQAVLPGVVQTHWAGQISDLLFSPGCFQSVLNLKFKQMILPETQVDLILAYSPDKARVSFSYQSQDVSYTSGVLQFAETQFERVTA